MSFWGGLVRLAQGKPVFEVPEEAKNENKFLRNDEPLAEGDNLQPKSQQAQMPVVRSEPKVIPEVIIEEWDVDTDGSHMECRVNIKNRSSVGVELDKVRILKTTRELDTFLRAGEERQFLIYSGPKAPNTYEKYCELQFKDQKTGDYFSAVHFLDFEKESDTSYVITHIRFQPPIRDI